ncbi:MAG TPA: ribonuclease R [Lachnospiraceae bacterium]|nr:ribonuclease R [Lachnospiraceae bacterium]
MTKSFEARKKLILKLLSEKSYTPMKEKELAIFLQVRKEEREELKEVLQTLLSEGSAVITKRGRYKLPETTRFTGVYRASRQGYGFIEVEGENEDFHVEEGASLNAFDGDTVEAEFDGTVNGKLREAVVTAVLHRAHETVVGTFEKSANRYGFVIPDNKRLGRDIFIPLERSMDAGDGQKVVCEILDFGSERRSPDGRISEILGYPDEPGIDVLSVIRVYGLPDEFPEKVINQAEKVAETVSPADMEGRRDLRDKLMVTIDSEDAKDLDDAVSLEKDGETYILGVHISDVANYVQERSALDKEALKRGTSVYLADRVIPMLPERLSNGICSLNEKTDRLTLSCIMRIDKNGEITDHEIIESVIRTDRRMTYTAVNEILSNRDQWERYKSGLETDPALSRLFDEYRELIPMFFEMGELAVILRERRKKRGSVDFDIPECKLELDEDGYPVNITPYDRNAATKLIEDFMLAANETVAEHYFWLKYPFVYRTHDDPDPDKMKKLAAFINGFGYSLRIKGDEIHPKELQKLLVKCEDTPEEGIISRLALRSMQRAKYDTACTGHFGLACRYYCHFTSPIRRYPDLQIHRIIKDDIRKRLTEDRLTHYEELLPSVCLQSSARERAADEAEREVDKLKKAEYMRSKAGEVYEGVISGLNSYGMYVELPNTVEGFVHVNRMDDYYSYNEESYELVGDRTGKTYVLGQRIRVRVDRVDMERRIIDFAPA